MPREQLDRRRFLSGAAALGATAALGAAARPAPALSGRAAPADPAGPGGASPAQWAALAATLTGRLVRPGDRAYPVDKLLYDPRFDGLQPAAIAFCASPDDVARCLGFARAHGVEVAARAGGHSYGGYSSGTGRLVLDVTAMREVVPAAAPGATARVGAGARLIDVYNGLGGHGQLVPGGSCPTVGVAGLALGGGVGVFARRFGLATDHVAALTLVTADGVVRRCSAAELPSLYWACRGGGGGNFGVVTSFELVTQAIPELTLFTYDFGWSQARDLLGAWQRWTATLNDAVWSNCQLLSGDGTYARVAGVACASVAQTSAWLRPLLDEVAPASSFLGGEPYQRAMMVEAGCAQLSVAACHLDLHPPGVLSRQAFVASSNYVAAPMGDARLQACVDVVDELAATLPTFGGGLVFDALGGRVNAVAPSETAFVHRRFLCSIQSSFNWASASAAQLATGHAWLATVRRDVYDPANGAYQNYVDPSLPDYATAYYGANLPRLSRVKSAYDPDGVFTFPQSVPPA